MALKESHIDRKCFLAARFYEQALLKLCQRCSRQIIHFISCIINYLRFFIFCSQMRPCSLHNCKQGLIFCFNALNVILNFVPFGWLTSLLLFQVRTSGTKKLQSQVNVQVR